MIQNPAIRNWLLLCCFHGLCHGGGRGHHALDRIRTLDHRMEARHRNALPPLSEADWQAEFNLYKASPEFAHKHFWMNLDRFQENLRLGVVAPAAWAA
jgi:hypothetical protein